MRDALVDAELKPLKLGAAHFRTEIASDPANGGAEGIDRVEFWVQTNPGSRPGPLTKVASGGELAIRSGAAQDLAGQDVET